jgi:hypothetical protein
MAVAISNGNVNINGAGAFDEAENYNLGMFSTTVLALSSTRTIAFTPGTARNSKGVILCLRASASTVDRSAVATLQENVASVWTDRSSATLTAAQIKNSVTNSLTGDWIVYFNYADYAVTAAASTWRFSISQTGGSTGNWSLKTSDATNPFYIEVPDKAYTFVNDDCLIVKPGDQVTINASFSIKGVLGTGDTVNGIAAIIGKSSAAITTTSANEGLVWENPPASSYTMTVDGLVVLGAHSGFRRGTSAARIPFAQQSIISWSNRTVGTAFSCFCGTSGTGSVLSDRGASLFNYGEIPGVRKVTLNGNHAIGATALTVNETPTGWANTNRLYVGMQKTAGVGSATLHTISSIVGTTINLGSALATAVRNSGGYVVNLDAGYGCKEISNTTNRALNNIENPSNLVYDGCLIEQARIRMAWTPDTSVVPLDDAANMSALTFSNSLYYTTGGASFYPFISASVIQSKGITADAFYAISGTLFNSGSINNAGVSGPGTITNCYMAGANSGHQATLANQTFDSNIIENSSSVGFFLLGANATITNNNLWGNLTAGILTGTSFIAPASLGGNVYNQNTVAIQIDSNANLGDTVDTNSVFGNIVANTTDVTMTSGLYIKWVFLSPTGAVNVSTSNLLNTIDGTHIGIADYNDTSNDDRNWLTNGYIVRTGDSLSDTTVWNGTAFAAATSGQFGMRFQPTSGTGLLKWRQNYPTGNIQNMTMQVTCRLKINNAAFYAGTHTKPTLRVKYDNTTETTAVATGTTSAQQLQVTFTPLTTYGQITITFEMATDATGTNAYVYLGEMVPNLPDGVAVNTTDLSKWANAMPVVPSLATIRNPTSLWDEPTSIHTIDGSFGDLISDIESSVPPDAKDDIT